MVNGVAHWLAILVWMDKGGAHWPLNLTFRGKGDAHWSLILVWMFVVNFEALAQASDFRIERRSCLTLLNAGFETGKSETPNRRQTECPHTNRLSYRGSSKNLNSTGRPYDEWAFSLLDFTADWLSHLALVIYMFVVVNFDALAQASDFRIERRQVVYHRWMPIDLPSLYKWIKMGPTNRSSLYEGIKVELTDLSSLYKLTKLDPTNWPSLNEG